MGLNANRITLNENNSARTSIIEKEKSKAIITFSSEKLYFLVSNCISVIN